MEHFNRDMKDTKKKYEKRRKREKNKSKNMKWNIFLNLQKCFIVVINEKNKNKIINLPNLS